MKFGKVASALVFSLATAAASAEDLTLQPGDFSLTQANGVLTGQFQLEHKFVGSFTDTVNFGIFDVDLTFNISLTSRAVQPINDIDFVSASLNGVPLTFTKSSIGGVFEASERGALSFPLPVIPAGTPVILTIIGFAGEAYNGTPGSLAASYTGTVTAVPEPHPALMLLAGLVAVGWIVRRRSA